MVKTKNDLCAYYQVNDKNIPGQGRLQPQLAIMTNLHTLGSAKKAIEGSAPYESIYTKTYIYTRNTIICRVLGCPHTEKNQNTPGEAEWPPWGRLGRGHLQALG